MEQPLCRIVKRLMSNKRDEQDCHHTQIFQLASLVSHGYDGFSRIFHLLISVNQRNERSELSERIQNKKSV